MTSQKFFITGTDTEIGKTYITCELIRYFIAKGKTVAGIKPIAAGADLYPAEGINQQWKNEDALALQAASNVALPYHMVNPVCFPQPCSPHIAAIKSQEKLDVETIPLIEVDADIILYEGAGGWFTPLNNQETFADWVVQHQLSVILVVGMKLGCLNHAQLSLEAITNSGLRCVGWVANFVSPDMLYAQENLDYLIQKLPVPCIGICEFNQSLEIKNSIELSSF